MKKLNLIKALFIFPILIYTPCAIAQTTQDQAVPKAVTAAFNLKYPKGKFKKWSLEKDNYSGIFNMEGQICTVVYDKSGTWVNTSTKIKWTWKLPKEVKDGLKKSKYSSWDVDGIKKIETPKGQYYQLWVDNSNLQIDAFHDSIFTKNILVDFKPDGTIGKEKDITEKSLF